VVTRALVGELLNLVPRLLDLLGERELLRRVGNDRVLRLQELQLFSRTLRRVALPTVSSVERLQIAINKFCRTLRGCEQIDLSAGVRRCGLHIVARRSAS
jgi:hypothetical protein